MDDLAAVQAVNANWNRAYQERDVALLETVFAPDWLAFLPDGRGVVTRAEMLHNASNNPPAQLEFSDESTFLFGQTALVRGLLTASRSDATHRQRYLRIFEKRDGHWQAIAAQIFPF